MEKLLNWFMEPQGRMWTVIIILLVGSKVGIRLDYISVIDIIKNHLNCFRNKEGKILIIPVLDYIILPFFMGAATVNLKKINDTSINIITVIVSILTAMLFTMLTMIIDMNGKIKENPKYYSKEAEISKKALLETYYTIMFEILISIVLLLLCFFNCFTKKFGNIQSFLIYSLMYLLIINLLMIIKRVFRVIDTDMRK